MAKIVRLTTPTMIFRTTDQIDLTLATDVHVTFNSFGATLDKTGEDVNVEAKSLGVYLHQEDTKFLKVGKCEVMINWKYPDGTRGSSDPDHPIIIDIKKNLLDRII